HLVGRKGTLRQNIEQLAAHIACRADNGDLITHGTSPVVALPGSYRNPSRVSPLAPTGERTGDDEAYSAVFTAVVTVFVLLVVRVSIVVAIVHREPGSPGFTEMSNTPKRRQRQALSSFGSG